MWTNGLQLAGGGTAFPADPTTNDVFFRTDLRVLFSWTGTAWSPLNSEPVGGIIAWHKSFANTPQTLPWGWVECNGQTLSDTESVYNGQTIPNLNGNAGGTKRFLRGDTTSNTFSNSNIAPHTHTMNHGHTLDTNTGASKVLCATTQITAQGTSSNVVNDFNGSTGSTGSDDTYPAHMTVVWIMRVK